MSPISIRIALLTLAASTMAAGSVQALADASHGGKSSAPGKSAHDRRMTLAPQKPNGSGIVVRYRVEATPQAGKTVPVAVSLERITGSDATVAPERGRRRDEMVAISGSQALLTNIVLAWNTSRMNSVVDKLRKDGVAMEDDWLRRIGPAHFGHINFRGTFSFALGPYADVLVHRRPGQPRTKTLQWTQPP